MNGPSDMLSHGALSSGRIWLAIVVPSLASRGISWHSALTSRLFASLCHCSAACPAGKSASSPSQSPNLVCSARKLIQIVALCNSFPLFLTLSLSLTLCFFLLLLLLLLFALSHSASCPFHYLDLCPASNGESESILKLYVIFILFDILFCCFLRVCGAGGVCGRGRGRGKVWATVGRSAVALWARCCCCLYL